VLLGVVLEACLVRSRWLGTRRRDAARLSQDSRAALSSFLRGVVVDKNPCRVNPYPHAH
jgi:hypothetical protein